MGTTPSQNERKRFNEPTIGFTATVNQHFVPRGYLRAFERNERRVRVFDFESQSESERSSKSVASADGYYDFELVPPDDLELPNEVATLLKQRKVSAEDWLARVEDPGLAVIQRLIESPANIGSLSAVDQFSLARFLAVMFFRGPKFRKFAAAQREEVVTQLLEVSEQLARRDLPEELAEAAISHWRSLPDHEILHEDSPHQPPELVASMLSETTGWANLLYAMDWELQVAGSDGIPKLYTSDNPFARRLPAVRPDWQFGGFTDWDYWIPLAPQLLLRIRHWKNGPQVGHPGSRRLTGLSAWAATYANLVQSAEAVRFAYGDGVVRTQDDARKEIFRLQLVQEVNAMALGWKPGAHLLPPGVTPSTPAEMVSAQRLLDENEAFEALLESSGSD